MAARVVLVGAPGAGKSTVGAVLAQRLGVELLDTDAAVEQAAGMSVSDVFVTQGEAAFRALERTAVADALAHHDGVVALGGGAVVDPGTRALLASAPTVWLRVGLTAALSRVGMTQARPLLLGNVRGRLLALLEERAPFYAEVATVTVDTDDRTPEDVAADVLAALGLEAPR